MTRYSYNTQVRPPAPFVHVTIGRPLAEADVVENVPAQLDTAADMTVVPWQIVDRLGLVQLNEVPAIGFGGHIVNVPTFLVQLTIRQFGPMVVPVLSSRDEPVVLLGRDVLNNYRVILDGPERILEIE